MTTPLRAVETGSSQVKPPSSEVEGWMLEIMAAPMAGPMLYSFTPMEMEMK